MALRLNKAEASKLGLTGLSFGIRNSARTKMGNVLTWHDSPVIGEKRFDSKWEAELCKILDAMVMAKEIRTFLDQVRISLRGKSVNGKRRYMQPDFMIIDLFGRSHFWDAKGNTTADWEIKRDMAWEMHQIDVHAVKKGKALPVLYEDDELDIIRQRA